MAGRVTSIYAEIGLKADKLKAGLNAAKGDLSKFGNDMKSNLSRVKQFGSGLNDTVTQLTGFNIAQLGAAGAIAMGVKQVGEAITFFRDYAEQVRTMSAATGMSNEETSKMIQVFDDANVEIGLFTAAARKMVQNGIQPSIANMSKLADEYVALKDPVAKSKLLIDNFGRSGLEMGKLMAGGSDGIKKSAEAAEKFGQVLDDKAIASAEEYRLALDDMNDAAEGLKIQLARGLVPALTDVLVATNNFVAGALEFDEVSNRILDLQRDGVIAFDDAASALLSMSDAQGVTEEATRLLDEAESRLIDHSRLAPEYLGKQEDATYDLAEAEAALKESTDKTAGIYRDIKSALEGSNIPLGEKIKLLENLALASGETTVADLAMDRAIKFLTKSLELGYISSEDYERITGELATQALGGEKAVRAIEQAIKDNTTAAGNASEPVGTLAGNMGTLEQQTKDAKDEVDWLKQSIDRLKDKTVTITVKTIAKNLGASGGILAGGPGGAHGLDMVVPPGHPNDSFPVFATSGERVTITPPGNKGSGNGISIGEINFFIEGGDADATADAVMSRFAEVTRAAENAGLSFAG